jgi:NAD(P)-dependent dehydrogenase (short-subunit alcohol dehydrogenase family)
MANAAVQPTGGIAVIKPKSWELEFNINVHGAFRSVRAVLPAMQAQKSGNIITITSVAAETAASHYGATKLAVEAMTRSLAREMKDAGIAVNALKPVTAIETPGLLYGRAEGRPGRTDLPRPDSYVEAAILLAMQTADAFTGQVMNDAQLIARLGSPETQARFRKENPEPWVKAMGAS